MNSSIVMSIEASKIEKKETLNDLNNCENSLGKSIDLNVKNDQKVSAKNENQQVDLIQNKQLENGQDQENQVSI